MISLIALILYNKLEIQTNLPISAIVNDLRGSDNGDVDGCGADDGDGGGMTNCKLDLFRCCLTYF